MTKETLLKFKEYYEKIGDDEQLAKVNKNLSAYGVAPEPKTKKEKK